MREDRTILAVMVVRIRTVTHFDCMHDLTLPPQPFLGPAVGGPIGGPRGYGGTGPRMGRVPRWSLPFLQINTSYTFNIFNTLIHLIHLLHLQIHVVSVGFLIQFSMRCIFIQLSI